LNSSEDLHTIHNQVMSTISLFLMRQEKGQSVQSFWDQFAAMRQECEQLGLIGQSEQEVKAVLNREGVTELTTEQLEKAKKMTVEEFLLYFSYTLLIAKNMVRSLKTWKTRCYRKRTHFQRV